MARRAVFWFAAAATVVLAVELTKSGKRLQTGEAPRGIVSLELASTVERVEAIVESWRRTRVGRGTAVDVAKRSIYLDFPFIVAYSTVLAGGCWWVAGVLGRRGLPGAGGVRTLGWLQLAAGALDVVENAGMLIEIDRAPAGELVDWVPPVVAVAARTKFTLAGVGVVAILCGLAVRWLPVGRRRAGDGG